MPSYLRSLSNRERAWITKCAKALTRPYVAPWDTLEYLLVPQEHLRLLDMYDKVVNYLIPGDKSFVRPAILHRSSHSGNIFLSQEALLRDGTIKISAITDWQHTAVLPLYLTADFPRFIKEVERGPRQEDADYLKEVDVLHEAYHALYKDTGYDIAWSSAIPYGTNFSMSRTLPDAAARCWHGGQFTLRRELIRAARNWEKIAGPDAACPLGSNPFSEQEIAQVEEDEKLWKMGDTLRSDMAECIGVRAVDGWVKVEECDRALQNSARLCDAWVSIWNESCGGTPPKGLDSPADVWPYEVQATSKE